MNKVVYIVEAIREGSSWVAKVFENEEKAEEFVEANNRPELKFIITKMKVW